MAGLLAVAGFIKKGTEKGRVRPGAAWSEEAPRRMPDQ